MRIDMSEYMEKHSVARLVGAPPGYVGYEEGGQLTEAVRRRPYSVVLLDEIEKAHSDVFNILLQVIDDGRLTDGQGRTVDFKNTVLIMTSNIPGGRAGVEAHFKPEFINRLDDIVEFDPLSREQLREIVDVQVARLIVRVAERGVDVELTDAARDLLGDLGYDPAYGARPLKRVISKHLVDPLALGLLKGEFAAGDHVVVDADGRRAALHARASAAVASPARLRRPARPRIVSGTALAAFGSVVAHWSNWIVHDAHARAALERELLALATRSARSRRVGSAEPDRAARLAGEHVVRVDGRAGAVKPRAAEAHALARGGAPAGDCSTESRVTCATRVAVFVGLSRSVSRSVNARSPSSTTAPAPRCRCRRSCRRASADVLRRRSMSST